jgi:hypothetical protein
MALVPILFAVPCSAVPAQDKDGPAVCVTAAGALLARTEAGWQAVRAGDAVKADRPVVALFDATMRSGNGAVEVRLVTDVKQRGPLPILETAAIVHADAGYDLSITPLRGLIVLTNIKKQGPAKLKLISHGESIDLTLKEPGSKLALEVYSRHVPGLPQLDDPKKDEPVMHLFCIALAGESFLHGKERGVTLHAPPGPAVLVWDSLVREPEVTRLEELPPEVVAIKQDQKHLEAACAWGRKLGEAPLAKVLAEGVASTNEMERNAAVTAMGALDELPALLSTLAGSTYPDARERAILVLRHWLGRAPGQTSKLDAALKKAGYSTVQSHDALQLLYGFTPEQKRQAITYDWLIDDLKHARPAIRELAHWHLVRLAPAGKTIAFDALASEAQRERAYDEWRKLIPAGKLPPKSIAP